MEHWLMNTVGGTIFLGFLGCLVFYLIIGILGRVNDFVKKFWFICNEAREYALKLALKYDSYIKLNVENINFCIFHI